MSTLSLTLILIFIMDPLGNLSSYLKLREEIPANRRLIVLGREMGFALALMLLFSLLGELIFGWLEISKVSLHLSAGVILFLTALKILFLSPDSPRANLPKGEPFFVPLAIPLIAGPSLLATIMVYANLETEELPLYTAIFIAWCLSFLILAIAPWLQRTLKHNGLTACEKLVGMVLIILSIQRFLAGIALFISEKGLMS